MATQKPTNLANPSGQASPSGSVADNGDKDKATVTKLSEHELAQLAVKIYALLRQELQLERERWL